MTENFTTFTAIKRDLSPGTHSGSILAFLGPKFFRPKFFHGRPRGLSAPKCLFSQDLDGLTEVFRRTSAGISGEKLPLWADFSFLNFEEL